MAAITSQRSIGSCFPTLSCELPKVPPSCILAPETHILVQRVLLFAGLICSVVSMVPGGAIAASLASRGICLLASGIKGTQQWNDRDLWGKIALVTQVAGLVIGIAAIIALSPLLLIVAGAADAAFRMHEIYHEAKRGNLAGVAFNVAILAADVLLIAAVAKGSFELLIASSVISFVCIMAMLIKIGCCTSDREDLDHVYDNWVNVATSIHGIAESEPTALIMTK